MVATGHHIQSEHGISITVFIRKKEKFPVLKNLQVKKF
ncbi:hypothetical protein BVRB_6g151090 [Beta vulgaris subsp. vulgaris]|nr:hypothetical protein BVRB_6g151090 [Beta vulgaris subsp. vulgaris]